MSAILTYHVRAGQLSAVATGRAFHVPTYRDPSRVTSWEKVQELRPGKYTLWDHCFELPDRASPGFQSQMPTATVIRRVSLGTSSPVAARLELYDYPGEYAQRFDGTGSRPSAAHNYSGSAVYVGDRQTGVCIHGWPPCNLKQCVVVLQQWHELVRAIAGEPELSFAIMV